MNQSYGPKDYQFLIDIAGLVVGARRSLSYTYAIRFFLKGEQKQAFFDFIQGDLERSLEALNKRMEENWLDYVEYDIKGKLILGLKFNRYKETVTTSREVVERHFNTVMGEIMNGLPSIANVDEDDDQDYTFDADTKGSDWTCRTCQVKNNMHVAICQTCRTAKPNLNVRTGQK